MKRMTLILLLAASSIAMAGRYEEINEKVTRFDETYELEQVEKAIKKALIGRDWRIKETSPGIIQATLRVRNHVVKIRIEYTQETMTVFYVDSTNMGYEEKGDRRLIHRKYNGWVQNIQTDTLTHLSA